MSTPYRAGPASPSELYALSVSTARGRVLVGVLGGLSGVFAVVYGVTVFWGAPPGVEQYAWTMLTAALLLAVSAFVIQHRRGRKLGIVRHGTEVRLVVPDEGTDLLFPLEVRGNQYVRHVNNIPIHEVNLQLVDARRHAITLHTNRGAAFGPQPGWDLPPIDPGTARCDVFDVPMGAVAEVRRLVEELSEELRGGTKVPDGSRAVETTT